MNCGQAEKSRNYCGRSSVAPPAELTYLPDFEVSEGKDGHLFKADISSLKDTDLNVTVTGSQPVSKTVSGARLGVHLGGSAVRMPGERRGYGGQKLFELERLAPQLPYIFAELAQLHLQIPVL